MAAPAAGRTKEKAQKMQESRLRLLQCSKPARMSPGPAVLSWHAGGMHSLAAAGRTFSFDWPL